MDVYCDLRSTTGEAFVNFEAAKPFRQTVSTPGFLSFFMSTNKITDTAKKTKPSLGYLRAIIRTVECIKQ